MKDLLDKGVGQARWYFGGGEREGEEGREWEVVDGDDEKDGDGERERRRLEVDLSRSMPRLGVDKDNEEEDRGKPISKPRHETLSNHVTSRPDSDITICWVWA